ncbi:MAG: acyltransferase domain-containing protein, partial [Acidimicrobiaceae bacterium]|nr:acyltransferase domain-containing protein [Acidimicrobiaceae bacterium]
MSAGEPIAVVGLGCAFPGAADVEGFWANIAAGRTAIDAVPGERIDERLLAAVVPGVESRRGGFLPADALLFDPTQFGIMPVAVDAAEPDQLVALRIAADALEDFGGVADVARERIGVILGRGGYLTPGVARLEQRVRTAGQLVSCLRTLLPDLDDDRLATIHAAFCSELGDPGGEGAIGLVPNLAASRIANRLDLGGPAFTIDAACASSLVAVDAAIGELRARRCDLVLAGGVHHCHDLTLWAVFAQLGALSPTGALRPFGRQADGILIGEGTGIVVLERLADATALGHDVYATILGSGVSSDGRDASLMSPRTDGQVLALQRAYAAASVDPADVELVEGHGTATVAGDQAELETIRRVFGKRVNGSPDGVLGSVKSAIGHAMPAAGAAGLIKAVLAVHHGVLPPASEADDPQPLLAETRFQLLGEAAPWSTPLAQRLAGVNAFGFGGINAHLVVSGRGATDRRASLTRAVAPAEETFDAILLAGADASDLAAQLGAVEPGLLRGTVPSHPGPARLAIVDPTPRRVEVALRALEKGRPWRGRNDIWFEPEGLVASGGRLAFVFPGVEPSFASDGPQLARRFGRTTLPVPEGSAPLERQGWEIFELGRVLYDILADLGVHPDDVAGHSLGEWTASFATEMIDREQAAAYLAGLHLGTLDLPGVVYLALGCGVSDASELVADIEGFTVSHDNCPHQAMVCGPPEGVPEVRRRALARQVLVQEMPFRSGFHSPAFEPYIGEVHRHWASMRLQKPAVPMWSATTCAPYPDDPEEVRALAATHLLEAVRFRELTLRLHEHGCRVFVQLGVGSLAGFVEDTLRGQPHLAIAAQVAKRSGLAQLARVAAALWVEGVDVDLTRLLAPARPESGRRSGPKVRLNLGVPLVELPEHLAVTPTSASPRIAEQVGSSLALAHDALVAETVAASSAVLGAFAGKSSAGSVPPSVHRQTLTVSLTEQPWLRDHELYRQPPEWP